MKKIWIVTAALVTLLACIGVSYEAGRNAGFKTGSEWALMQADIVAQKAGVFMPVYLKDGIFRVVIRQPRGIYKKAWKLADQYEEAKGPARDAGQAEESEEDEAKDSI